MKSSRGFEDLLAYFNARGLEYLVVGAHAYAFHGKPRFTKDLDREELIHNKRAAGRAQDVADLEWLERGDPDPD